ncbi:hypothetical protein C8A00DRAFT_38998 [Chaetomidium leptoderma]|uniref:Uncharacterized protein n=1 Tax=Chaetomidium leptoderma TaxID=669021 RepID=A0AAN6ZSC2_9PEZI|nr:hypothetical protein C8A00DRAFT_38998 [Chaetomidium leptoderma]
MDRKRRLDGHYNNNNTFQNQGGGGGGSSTLDGEFETCVDALRRIQSFNHLARDHLAVLESQELVFGGGL